MKKLNEQDMDKVQGGKTRNGVMRLKEVIKCANYGTELCKTCDAAPVVTGGIRIGGIERIGGVGSCSLGRVTIAMRQKAPNNFVKEK